MGKTGLCNNAIFDKLESSVGMELMTNKIALTTILILVTTVASFLALYALDDFLYTKQCERDGVPGAESSFKNQVVNTMGAGLPLNFPWTKKPQNYDIGAHFTVYTKFVRSKVPLFKNLDSEIRAEVED